MSFDVPKHLRHSYSTDLRKKVRLNILQHTLDIKIGLPLALLLYHHHLHPDIFKSVTRFAFSSD